jgi:hypothetical protein
MIENVSLLSQNMRVPQVANKGNYIREYSHTRSVSSEFSSTHISTACRASALVLKLRSGVSSQSFRQP